MPKNRIDYREIRIIRARMKAKRARQAAAAAGDVAALGTWIVGRFILTDGGARVVLEAVRECPGGRVFDPSRPTTQNFREFYRWGTRQAARQWHRRHPDPRLQPINLKTLRGRQD